MRISTLEGRWDVDWSNRIAPGQFERVSARSRIEFVIPQCVMAERFRSAVNGAPFWATALLTIGPDGPHRIWVDSQHGDPLLFDGEWRGDTLSFVWSRMVGDRQLRLRHLYFGLERDSFRTATYLSPAVGSEWQTVSEARYRRSRGTDGE